LDKITFRCSLRADADGCRVPTRSLASALPPLKRARSPPHLMTQAHQERFTPLCKFVFLDGPRDREALPCYEERLRPVTILPPISSVGETDAAPQFPALLIFVLTSTGAARKPHESFRPFVQLSVAFIFQTASQSTMDDGNAVRGQG
jgi:hypothetical protein